MMHAAKNGCDVVVNVSGGTIESFIMAAGSAADRVQVLLDLGAEADVADVLGNTSLHVGRYIILPERFPITAILNRA